MNAKPWIVFLSFFIFLNTLFFYGFVRDGTWVVLAVLSIFLYRRIGHLNFLAMSVSFLGITLVLLLVVDWVFKERIYYRPHEMLVRTDWDGFHIYEPGTDITFEQPHGDLRNMAPADMEFESVPRTLVFKVDAFGFRNATEYHGQRYVLVGDSFIVGTSNSQENTLDAQLQQRYGIGAYNLGQPGGAIDYAHNIRKLENEYGGGFRALVFLFEGNDFGEESELDAMDWVRDVKAFYKTIFRVYKSFFRDTHLYRYTFIAYKALTGKAKEPPLTVLPLNNGRKVGVYRHYIEEARKTDYTLTREMETAFRPVKDKIHTFFFIPTKYRVYAELWQEPLEDLPDANLEAARELGQRLGIPVVDLTPALRAAARRQLQENGTLVFWPDDTHWNEHGIATAARVVCETVQAPTCTPSEP